MSLLLLPEPFPRVKMIKINTLKMGLAGSRVHLQRYHGVPSPKEEKQNVTPIGVFVKLLLTNCDCVG